MGPDGDESGLLSKRRPITTQPLNAVTRTRDGFAFAIFAEYLCFVPAVFQAFAAVDSNAFRLPARQLRLPRPPIAGRVGSAGRCATCCAGSTRSEEHTSELQ